MQNEQNKNKFAVLEVIKVVLLIIVWPIGILSAIWHLQNEYFIKPADLGAIKRHPFLELASIAFLWLGVLVSIVNFLAHVLDYRDNYSAQGSLLAAIFSMFVFALPAILMNYIIWRDTLPERRIRFGR